MTYLAPRHLYRLLFGFMLIVVVLSACQSTTPSNSVPPPIGEVTRPELVDILNWERNPDTVVFRAEITGGSTDEFITRNDVPYCTIYGDNKIVWTASNARADDTVVFDYVSDEAIRLFVNRLITIHLLYNYKTGAELQMPSDVAPLLERMTLYVNGLLHQTDSFGGWDYAYFQTIRDECRSISTSPIAFAPDAAWVSARRVEYDPNRSLISWNGEATGLRLAELADSGERRWIVGNINALLWDRLRNIGGDVFFDDNGETFQVAVEIPNVTVSSPPAP